MPVFKSLTKNMKLDEQKEQEQKKQEDEVAKKKRQEVDAEIQRKVAEFKLKMKTKAEVGPPGVALPTSLGGSVPPVNFTQPPPPLPFPQTIHRVQKDPVLVSGGPMPNAAPPGNPQPPPQKNLTKNNSNANTKGNGKGPLHKDFQEALDIIFPSDKKPELHNMPPNEQMDLNMMYPGMGPPGPPMGPPFGPPMGPQFGPPMGMMPPQMNGPPIMMGYDFNPPPIFNGPGPPQLYDRQVPIVPNPSTHMPPPGNMMVGMHQPDSRPPSHPDNAQMRQREENRRNEMDEFAMLGIDAADVGAGLH